ncbi:hypothetical protein ACQ4LE_008668 [Meloidogyne hapla]
MAYAYKDDKKAEEPQPVERIRIILTSQNVKALEKVCEKLIHGAREEHLAVKGPIRMPTKVLRITTRKTPCGEGSKTWDHFQVSLFNFNKISVRLKGSKWNCVVPNGTLGTMNPLVVFEDSYPKYTVTWTIHRGGIDCLP